MAAKKGNKGNVDAIFGNIHLPQAEEAEVALSKQLTIDHLSLFLVRPDPIQPRRVLPERVHYRFHKEEISPTQALRELVLAAQEAAREAGRPFNQPLELVAGIDSDREEVKLSPEEAILYDLIHLALTLNNNGQVNPLTVIDVSIGSTRLYRIETGERRYWATWLLKDFIDPESNDGTIPCIIIPHEMYSPFRQAKENTARKGLTAMAMARQAALLLLSVYGFDFPNQAVTNDFYRQAIELDLRSKQEFSEEIYNAMGSISRQRFSQYKVLLKLPDEVWELADRYDLDERILRLLLPLEPQDQVELTLRIVQQNLTAAQVQKLLEAKDEIEDEKLSSDAKKARTVARVASKSFEKLNPQEVAYAMVEQEGDASIARTRLLNLVKLLTEAEKCLPL
jgi:hypothetical protein